MTASSASALPPMSQIRNLGIMAHIDAGKTTTTERILYYTGVSSRMGEVHDGASVMDWMEQEQERGISITAASTSFAWTVDEVRHHCNLIDTPGHIDFTIEVERSLRVLDGAVAIFCAVSGVEPQSETVWRQADRHGIPRIAFINKCDRVGADPNAVAEEIRHRLNANPIVVQLPHKLEAEFNGIVDLIHFKSRVWDEGSLGLRYQDSEVPEDLLEEAQLARGIMLEALAEVDDSVMEMYLAETEISPKDIVAALRRATLAMRAVPVVMGAALQNKGVQNLLDAIVDYLPSPGEVGPVHARNAAGEDVVRTGSKDEPLAALAFKIMNDPQVGQVTYLRVYSGVLKSGDQVLNATRDKNEKLGRLLRMHASYREDIDELAAGDIGAAVGLRVTGTGDTICDPRAPLNLEHIDVPAPVAEVVVEPETDEDSEKLQAAFAALASEDPSLDVVVDPRTSQTILRGMGELHLEIVVERLARQFKVRARAGRPEVAYREGVRHPAEYNYLLERVAAGAGQFAGVKLRVESGPPGSQITVVDALHGEASKAYLAAIEAGVLEAAAEGTIAKFPMMDLRVSIDEIAVHPVDSSEAAFKIAAFRCLHEVVKAAEPILMEPLMEVEVVVPDEFVGEVVSDLHARRGKITGIEARVGVQVVACLVPLSNMFGYSTDLRSRTQGRATYSMQLNRYQEVPASLRDAVVARVLGA